MNRLEVGVHDASIRSRPDDVERHRSTRDKRTCLENLVDPLPIAQRRHQQNKPGLIRQIRNTVRERSLEPAQ